MAWDLNVAWVESSLILFYAKAIYIWEKYGESDHPQSDQDREHPSECLHLGGDRCIRIVQASNKWGGWEAWKILTEERVSVYVWP